MASDSSMLHDLEVSEESVEDVSTASSPTTVTRKRKNGERFDIDKYFTKNSDRSWTCRTCKKSLTSSHSNRIYHAKTHEAVKVPSRTLTSMKFFKRTPPTNLMDHLIYFIIKGQHPFTIVDEPHFQAMLRYMNKDKTNSELMSATTIKTRMEKKFNETRSQMKRVLQDVDGKISLTTDMWTSGPGKPFLAITAHFLGPSGALESMLVEFCHAPYPHTGTNVQKYIYEALEDLQIASKVLTITTDNAGNNNDLGNFDGELSSVTHVRCIAHVLHLAVFAGLSEVAGPLGRLRNLMGFLKNSPKQDQRILQQTTALGLTYLRPINDVKTRWNSTLDMIHRAIHLKTVICNLQAHYPRDFKDYPISVADWGIFRALQDALVPYEKATRLLSGYKYCTYSLVIPALLVIEKQQDTYQGMASKDLPQGIKNAVKKMQAKLREFEGLLKTPDAFLATILDPRFKLNPFKDPAEMQKQKRFLIEQFNMGKLLYNEEEELFGDDKPASNEVELYLAYPRDVAADPIQFWQSHKSSLPILSKLAMDSQIVQSTSVPSEQAFSNAGNLITKKRNRLANDTIREHMCLSSWFDYLESHDMPI